ncbi:MAG: Mpo1-like protein [Polyangiales bacterium]
MALVKLNEEWSDLMTKYAADHQNPVNQACHSVGIPLIAASIPMAATVIGLPLAIPMFTVGWTFQFVGHAFEGKKPSFVEDKRQLLVGLMWWTKKVGLPLVS